MRARTRRGVIRRAGGGAPPGRSEFTILARNWRCEIGEIDVVALDGSTVVVCEVKTRSGLGYGSGLEAVTREKAARLRELGLRWLVENGPGGVGLRFDVLAVHGHGAGRPRSSTSGRRSTRRDAAAWRCSPASTAPWSTSRCTSTACSSPWSGSRTSLAEARDRVPGRCAVQRGAVAAAAHHGQPVPRGATQAGQPFRPRRRRGHRGRR